MEKKAFFGEGGLTATSANHYANLAKEARRNCENYLANARFYSTRISVIGNDEGGVISEGLDENGLVKIEETVKRIAELNGLTAFFREAIKEKERLAKAAASWEDEAKREELRTRGEYVRTIKPTREAYITEDDVKNGWSVGEQEKYLSLEAEAAAYGKYIHEDGCISEARIDLMKKLTNPKSVKENGRDTIIYTYEPTIDAEDVDAVFFRMQAHHREVQAELNGMKKRIQDAIDLNKLEVDERYRVALQQWNLEGQKIDREYVEVAEAERVERMRLMKEVEALRIVVPNRLNDVFLYLKNMQ